MVLYGMVVKYVVLYVFGALTFWAVWQLCICAICAVVHLAVHLAVVHLGFVQLCI